MDRGTREALARFAAPAAFLLAVSIAVVLVRAGLRDGDGGSPPPTAIVETQTVEELPRVPTVPRVTTTPTTTSETGVEFYEIRSGDTLAAVAARFGTTVEQLLILNPDADPVALRIGQRIRVQ